MLAPSFCVSVRNWPLSAELTARGGSGRRKDYCQCLLSTSSSYGSRWYYTRQAGLFAEPPLSSV